MGMNKGLSNIRYNIIRLFFIPVIFLFLHAVFFHNELPAKNSLCGISISNNYNKSVFLRVEIADTDSRRQTGLMYRGSLDENSGMLFVFENEHRLNFWMKNTLIPLSIAYIGRNGLIKDIINMKPLDTSVTYPSSGPALYAIEVNAGWFKKNNITVGCRINLNGCFGK
jgi:hypothetical protein